MNIGKKILIGCFIMLSSFLAVFCFILISGKMDKVDVAIDINNQLDTSEKTVDMLLEEVLYNKSLIVKRDISSRYMFILTMDDKSNYESKIIDKKYVGVYNYDKILKDDRVSDFWSKVYDLLSLKYPVYIVNGIKNGNGSIYYDIYDNEIIVYFLNYSFKPSYSDIVSIRVNYNEIQDYLNFAYSLDDDYKNEDGTMIDDTKKHIAFTFDDGPGGNVTKGIVDSLVDNKAKATFFMIGNKLNNNKDIVSYVYNNGMEIGCHTYSHLNMKKSDLNTIVNEINISNDTLKSIIGDGFSYLRPPYGLYSNDELNSINYPFIIWNIDTSDWRYKDTDRIANHILDNACDGCIVLMHDLYNTTLEAVKRVLPELYSRGYQVVDVTDLAKLKGIKLQEHNVYGYIK